MFKEKVLVVDDDELVRWSARQALKSWGYEVHEATDIKTALTTIDAERPGAVLLDIHLPDGSGLDILREIRQLSPQTIVIMITGNVQVADTLSALRGGAYDFISKPINLDELQVTLRNGFETKKLRQEVNKIKTERSRLFSFEQIVGHSPSMKETLALARKVAESEATSVLLLGESGTGKDLLAKAIHYASRRSDRPFVAINCATLPANLIESELFGYEKGAFTDAKSRKEGLFEQADGGTIFLDEIGEMELSLQAKLLRVLEESSFRRVGGLKDIPLDVRVIAASNRDLRVEAEAGRFRLDLYYRLSVIQIDIPPLRKRSEDILGLAETYIAHFNEKLRRHIKGLAPETKAVFLRYNWPGNVRELRNCIERAMILEESDLITLKYLPRGIACDFSTLSTEPDKGFVLPPGGVKLEEVELSLVRQAMERSNGNQTRAAELLGISRDQLRYRLKKIGLA
ncbi:MAG: sigma-54 dependent transcriptional regulator [Acidobacteriota bacterium]|nr:sigma-54 dependent transcriptional regulator [Blastocatellia bacterium]MDW8413075.1 sigma-54 dependent transcriptional regulator [Acidobacteriota bacterium]